MQKIVLSGLINIETAVAVDEFPIEYTPVDYKFFGINTTVSGVAYNVAKALKTLGTDVELLSITADDIFSSAINSELEALDISTAYLEDLLTETPQSVILYDQEGKRRINLDLKNIQELTYPVEKVKDVIKKADIVVATNINFSREIMRAAKRQNKVIASDVHVISDIHDDFNQEFMQLADILFFSNEAILNKEEAFLRKVIKHYDNEIIVVGMGAKGSLLYTKEEQKIRRVEAVETREIINTTGAGDALFSAFLHFYGKGKSAYKALKLATIFASYKIGASGGAKGFLDEKSLIELAQRVYS